MHWPSLTWSLIWAIEKINNAQLENSESSVAVPRNTSYLIGTSVEIHSSMVNREVTLIIENVVASDRPFRLYQCPHLIPCRFSLYSMQVGKRTKHK
jgi:hypothetical protein